MKKQNGFLGQLKGALFEETPAPAAPVESTVEPARPFHPFGGVAPIAAQVAANTTTSASAFSAGLNAMPAVPDDAALAQVNEAVFVPLSGNTPSAYMRFITMHEALGRPADHNLVLSALKAADPNFSPATVANDIRGHLDLLQQFCLQVDGDFQQEEAARVQSRDQQIAELEQQNQKAAEEIRRHTEETAARSAQMASLAQERANEQAKLTAAKSRMDLAEDHVRNSLQRSLPLFEALK